MSRPLIVGGRTIWIADAHREDGKRFVVHADGKVTVFLNLKDSADFYVGVLPQLFCLTFNFQIDQDRPEAEVLLKPKQPNGRLGTL